MPTDGRLVQPGIDLPSTLKLTVPANPAVEAVMDFVTKYSGVPVISIKVIVVAVLEMVTTVTATDSADEMKFPVPIVLIEIC